MNKSDDAGPLLDLVERYRSVAEIHDVFGVLVYTEEHPYMVKILRDDDFWNALDSKSGNRWVIFSVRPRKGETITRFPPSRPGYMQMMRLIHEWREPAENRRLLPLLGITDTEKLPLLVVFAQLASGDLLRAEFRISGVSVEETYASLKRAVTAASTAIKHVTPENLKNTFEVFNLFDAAAKQEVVLQRVHSVGRLIPYVEKIQKVLRDFK